MDEEQLQSEADKKANTLGGSADTLGKQADNTTPNKAPTFGAQSSDIKASPASPAPAAAGEPKKQGPTTSGRFTNLQSYLKAGSPEKLSAGISGRMGAQQARAQSQLGSQKTQFQADLAKSSDEAKSAIGAASGAISQISDIKPKQPAQAAPVSEPAPSSAEPTIERSEPKVEDLAKTVQSGLQTEYKGPMALGSAAALSSQGQKFAETAQNLRSQEGRSSIIRDFSGKPTMTSGQSKLDLLMLQGNKDALGNIARRAQQGRAFGTQVAQEAKTAEDLAKTAKQDVSAQAEGLKGQLGTAQENLQKAIQADIDANKATIEAAQRSEGAKAYVDSLLANNPELAKMVNVDQLVKDVSEGKTDILGKFNLGDVGISNYNKDFYDRYKTLLSLQGKEQEALELGEFGEVKGQFGDEAMRQELAGQIGNIQQMPTAKDYEKFAGMDVNKAFKPNKDGKSLIDHAITNSKDFYSGVLLGNENDRKNLESMLPASVKAKAWAEAQKYFPSNLDDADTARNWRNNKDQIIRNEYYKNLIKGGPEKLAADLKALRNEYRSINAQQDAIRNILGNYATFTGFTAPQTSYDSMLKAEADRSQSASGRLQNAIKAIGAVNNPQGSYARRTMRSN